MKDIVKTMGLKGAIILLIVILMAPKVAKFNPMLEIACLVIGAIFLVLYLEAYIDGLRANIVDNVFSEISKSKALDEKLNDLVREDLRNFGSQCLNEINTNTQNCIDVMNSCSQRLTSNVSEVKDNMISTFAQEATIIREQHSSIARDLADEIVKTNKDITEKIQATNEGAITKIGNIIADRSEAMNAMVAQSKLAIEENKAVVMTNIAKLAEIQVNGHKGLVESMADAFAGVDENLTLFRDCLEENLKAVAAVAPNAEENKDAIISAVNKHNAYLEKFQDKIKDKIKDVIEQETIEDYPNKATVISTKRNGIIIQSEMRENNKLALMAGYDNGRMVFSKTFDDAGNLTSETVYGTYGQVKERRTYRPVNGNIKVEVERF